MSEWVALLPLLGVVLGATLQHWFSRTAEARKQQDLLRSQSYVDYLRAVTKDAHSSSDEAMRSAVSEAADAKARIAVYGTPAVVEAMARFEEAGPVLDNERSLSRFVALASAMRKTAGRAAGADLRLVLFGKRR